MFQYEWHNQLHHQMIKKIPKHLINKNKNKRTQNINTKRELQFK